MSSVVNFFYSSGGWFFASYGCSQCFRNKWFNIVKKIKYRCIIHEFLLLLQRFRSTRTNLALCRKQGEVYDNGEDSRRFRWGHPRNRESHTQSSSPSCRKSVIFSSTKKTCCCVQSVCLSVLAPIFSGTITIHQKFQEQSDYRSIPNLIRLASSWASQLASLILGVSTDRDTSATFLIIHSWAVRR